MGTCRTARREHEDEKMQNRTKVPKNYIPKVTEYHWNPVKWRTSLKNVTFASVKTGISDSSEE